MRGTNRAAELHAEEHQNATNQYISCFTLRDQNTLTTNAIPVKNFVIAIRSILSRILVQAYFNLAHI